jgi:aldehyde dehydrogenase (NAD+)
VIALSPITSLDDAIDRLGNQGVQLTTLYLFAKLNEARYLSQFISTDITFVNHVPLSYLGMCAT